MRLSFVTENTVDVASDVNQSLLEADGLIVSRVTGIETAPPTVLIDGLRVAIASGATGAFSGKAGQLGVYVENGAFWQFYSPALCVFDGVTYLSAGGDWIQSSGGASTTDPRFTDAREWTAATISQAEVEEGAATTRRAFTAQRLRQGITAWFTGISGAIGRTILGRSTAAQVRGDLGLGTAAQATLTTSSLDATTGRVLKVGDFGVGGGQIPASSVTDLNDLRLSGVFNIVANTPNWAYGNAGGIVHQFMHRADNYITQIAYSSVDDSFSTRTKGNTDDWTTWKEIYHTGNLLDIGTSAATARTALELGTAATKDVGESAGNVMEVGAFGLGVNGYERGYSTDFESKGVINQFFSGNGAPGFPSINAGVTLAHNPDWWSQLVIRPAATPVVYVRSFYSASTYSPIFSLYHTGNTTKNPDGTLKASSPVINLYTDKHDLHNESQFGATPVVVRKSKGVYEITGTLGLRSEGWYLDTPSDRNGNKYFNIEWAQNITPEAVDGVVDEYRDDIVVTIETFERVWNKDTGLFENGDPIDINDLQDRFVQLRFNEIKVEHEELDDETITRSQE